MPPIEAVLEVLITKASPEAGKKIQTLPMVLISDLTQYLTGHTISYLEFS